VLLSSDNVAFLKAEVFLFSKKIEVFQMVCVERVPPPYLYIVVLRAVA
jgi:hypothetical protein